jgi:membrane protein DedA with SNARE-associated domain
VSFEISPELGYLLPALVGLESMGVPSPGETALVLAAVAASQGHLDLWIVIIIATAAAVLGDNVGYLIGRLGGRGLLESKRLPFRRRRLALLGHADRVFAEHGAKAVFIGRWIAVARVMTALAAGASGMRFRTFFVWNALGGLTWVATITLIAFYAGEAAVRAINHFGAVAAIVIGIVLVAGLVLFEVRRRRTQRA